MLVLLFSSFTTIKMTFSQTSQVFRRRISLYQTHSTFWKEYGKRQKQTEPEPSHHEHYCEITQGDVFLQLHTLIHHLLTITLFYTVLFLVDQINVRMECFCCFVKTQHSPSVHNSACFAFFKLHSILQMSESWFKRCSVIKNICEQSSGKSSVNSKISAFLTKRHH